jgi:hypothetical protein
MSKLKKVDIPVEICEFMGVPEGSRMNPMAVGLKFISYVAKNSLQQKGKIYVDENLRKVLKGADTPEYVTPGEFQKIMLSIYDTSGEISGFIDKTPKTQVLKV